MFSIQLKSRNKVRKKTTQNSDPQCPTFHDHSLLLMNLLPALSLSMQLSLMMRTSDENLPFQIFFIHHIADYLGGYLISIWIYPFFWNL